MPLAPPLLEACNILEVSQKNNSVRWGNMLTEISANKVPCILIYRRTNEASKIIKMLAYM
jgi:hypothetical protein